MERFVEKIMLIRDNVFRENVKNNNIVLIDQFLNSEKNISLIIDTYIEIVKFI